jgi:phosphoglycolate phosphatase
MTTVGVLTGLATRDELAPQADVVLPDIAGLPEWLSL